MKDSLYNSQLYRGETESQRIPQEQGSRVYMQRKIRKTKEACKAQRGACTAQGLGSLGLSSFLN